MKPWTDAHRREAAAAFCEAARDTILRGADPTRALDGARGGWSVESEDRFRLYLSYLDGFGQDATIHATVRRVRALAEGRLVRDKGWRVDREWYADDEKALAKRQSYPGMPLLRVARIRRAR